MTCVHEAYQGKLCTDDHISKGGAAHAAEDSSGARRGSTNFPTRSEIGLDKLSSAKDRLSQVIPIVKLHCSAPLQSSTQVRIAICVALMLQV